jgi:purine-binding chemotaxis protein CheW
MSSEPRASGTRDLSDTPLVAFADALLAEHAHAAPQAAAEIHQYVTFVLRDEEFAIPILDCREILRPGTITRIPEAPAQVRGVVNLRGRIVPVVDVRLCLGFDSVPITGRARLIVVELSGRLFALLVDRVARILKLSSSQMVPSSEPLRLACLVGTATFAEALIHLLDSERLLLAGPAAAPPTDKE